MWALKSVWLDEPRRATFPVTIPVNARWLNHHITTTVITLGGDAGTMGAGSISGAASCSTTCSGMVKMIIKTAGHAGAGADALHHLQHAKLGCPCAHSGITVTTKCGNAFLKFADLQTIRGPTSRIFLGADQNLICCYK